jgi:hypothetical protein
VPIRWGLLRDLAGKVPTQALLCTDLDASPEPIRAWFVQRWQLEVTCQARPGQARPGQARRAHLGMETQRPGTPLAIARTTPALFGLFSLVTRLAHPAFSSATLPLPQTAWYTKPRPTFADALALVRRQLWTSLLFQMSPLTADPEKIPGTLLDHLCHLLCYAA